MSDAHTLDAAVGVTAKAPSRTEASTTALRDRPLYKALLVNPWSYTVGAVVLAVLNVAHVVVAKKAWGVTTTLAYWGAWMWQLVGGDPHGWSYFDEVKPAFNKPGFGFLSDPGSLTNVGIIVGALLATLLASQFRVKRLKARRQIVAAVLGGLLMGFGARLAFGCNIGSMFSAIPSMSLHGWVFAASIFTGAAIGSKLLVRYFI
jgi:uncharacterized membrane protein YedE/YeeE